MKIQSFRKISHSSEEGFDEKDISAEQSQAKADPWFLGANEHKKRSKCFEAEATKREKKVGRLSFEFLWDGEHPFDRDDVEGSFKFTKKERITEPQDFRRAMKCGRRMTSRNFVVFIQKNENALTRVGIVVKKEIGQATFRNRMKRFVREFFRLHKHQIKGPYDIVIMIRKGCSFNRYSEAEEELRRLFTL